MSVAFSSDLGAYHSDYYQALAARNQLLNVNDNTINRQYRIEKQCAEPDVVNTKDGHAFVIFTGGRHKFDKGTSEIYDKSNNLGFLLGYEKSCNENLTLGAFAGYSNTDYKQDGRMSWSVAQTGHDVTEMHVGLVDNGNVRSGVFGAFGRYVKEKFAIAGTVSGSCSHYDFNPYIPGGDEGLMMILKNNNGYSICCTGNIRYNFSKNDRFEVGPLVAMSYCYIEQDAHSFVVANNLLQICRQFNKTLLGEAGVYGTYDYCARNLTVRMCGSITFALMMEKPDNCTTISMADGNNIGQVVIKRTREPSSYINVRLGVTSAVSKSIDFNADVKGSFAKDYYDIMGAIGMSYNF